MYRLRKRVKDLGCRTVLGIVLDRFRVKVSDRGRGWGLDKGLE